MQIEHIDTIVIGAGQAGLAAGYHLARHRSDFMILEHNARLGDNWRKRWDSLRLFTPAVYSSLPGMPLPSAPYHLPSKDEVADYLEAYVARFGLPVRLHTTVNAVRHEGDQFTVHTDGGLLTVRNVIVATGAFQTPAIPPFSTGLNPDVTQVHSSGYRNPDQLPTGPVLVVGAGNSGAQIALELAASREVWLAGPDVGHLPRRVLGKDLFWWIWRTMLAAPPDTLRGRHLRTKGFSGGDSLIGIDLRKVAPPSLHRVGRMSGVSGGKPVLDNGTVLDVSSVVWCTGFRPDFAWIHPNVCDANGYPRHERGVVGEVPGLYFLGLQFLYRKNSSLLGGVGNDAAFTVEHLIHRPEPAPHYMLPVAA